MADPKAESDPCFHCGKREGADLPGCRYCTPDPACNCSLSWRFGKGQGPDPAHCPKHGRPIYPPGETSG